MKLPELTIGKKTAKIPIVQGGMAIRLSTARLAAAVANEGGIGLIAASGMAHDELRYEIKLARSLTDGIIGINIMVAASDFAGIVHTAMPRLSRLSLQSSWQKFPKNSARLLSLSKAKRQAGTSAPIFLSAN